MADRRHRGPRPSKADAALLARIRALEGLCPPILACPAILEAAREFGETTESRRKSDSHRTVRGIKVSDRPL